MSKLLIHTIAFNRADLLKQMIDSIDTKHEYTIKIHVVSREPDVAKYVQTLIPGCTGGQFDLHREYPMEYYPPIGDKYPMTSMGENSLGLWYGYNVGVAHCWNDIIEVAYDPASKTDHVLFVNSDIKFGPGDIDKMVSLAEKSPTKLITICGTHGKHLDKWDSMNLSHGMACAILPKQMVEEVGYFDQNLFPAYNEDCDYMTRVWLHRNLGPIKPGYDKISAKDSPLVECVLSGNTHHEGSSVIYSDSTMKQLNSQTHGKNNKYYISKWGGLNDHETFTKPFDDIDSLYISKENRHNPYPDHWDRLQEKQNYYRLNYGN